MMEKRTTTVECCHGVDERMVVAVMICCQSAEVFLLTVEREVRKLENRVIITIANLSSTQPWNANIVILHFTDEKRRHREPK